MENQDNWCFAWFAQDPNQKTEEQTRAALVKAAKWKPGSTINIAFLDGDPAVQEKVKKVAMNWTAPMMANLTLKFLDPKVKLTGDVRISFKYSGSWSTIGTTCKQVPKNQPTMNYGWLNKTSSEEEIRRVVLHEFGHALGLIHEHQSPAGGIKWNKPQVYEDLSKPPNNWDKATIDHNMFETYAKKDTNFTALDPKSIMMYPIPAKWTLDGFSVGLNGELSKLDKQFIRQQYP